MTSRTRYFVIASLLVVLIGLGTGLVAYYVGFPTSAFFAGDGPDELQLVPPDATLVAFANVHEIMTSEVRDRARRALPRLPNGQEQFRNETGINVETDIDRVVACLSRSSEGSQGAGGAALVLARGRFDAVRIESLMRDHGASARNPRTTSRRLFAEASSRVSARKTPLRPPLTWALAENHVMGSN